MTMSRLFLMVFAVGMLVAAPAMADVPNCDCLDDYDATWPDAPDNCLFVCPGAWGLPGHTSGSISDNKICLYKDDLCTDPLVGFDCLRIDLSEILPDSICVCDEECLDYPYIFPEGATDVNGCTTFRFRGSILQLEDYGGVDVAWLQVCGCQDRPVRFRGPDVDADCNVGLGDFTVWSGTFNICPPQPAGYQHYTVYNGHCAPCPAPGLADFVIFSSHFGHSCTPGACDP
jgi:hypothetical protein